MINRKVAQLAARRVHTPEADGSSPSLATKTNLMFLPRPVLPLRVRHAGHFFRIQHGG